jgi:membrane protein YfhO
LISRPSFPKRLPALLPPLFLILVVLIPYWKLTSMRGVVITDDIFASDMMNDEFPYRFYLGEALKSGQLPLWYPPVYGGFPLLARAEAGVCYPLNLLLFGLLPPYAALNIVILLTLLIAAGGMYLYAREIEAEPAAALIAGISFAYSGFMVSHLKHLSMVNTVCWFPLGLFFIERALRETGRRSFLRSGGGFLGLAFVLGMQNLAGHIQTAYYSGLVYTAYFLFRSWPQLAQLLRGKRDETPQAERSSLVRRVAWFSIAMLLAAGIGAVQILPTWELVALSQRSGGVSFEYASQFPYDPADFKTFFYPYANGDIGDATYGGTGVFWEDYGYAGIVVLLLALCAAVARPGSSRVLFWGIAGAAAYLLVLGSNTPLYKAAFHAIPGMKFFRFPTRWLFVVDAALAILAACGATALLTRLRKRTTLAGLAGLLLSALATADLVYFQMRQNPIADASAWQSMPVTAKKIQEDRSVFRIYSVDATRTHIEAFSAARGWQGDLTPYLRQREFIQPSLNVLYGLSAADGYAQLTPDYVVDLWGDQNRLGWIFETASLEGKRFVPGPPFLKILSMFNVRYLLSPYTVESQSLEQLPSPAGVFLYRNPQAMPRAFMVSGRRLARDPAEAKAILLSDGFDPRREAILYSLSSPPPSGRPPRAEVQLRRYRTNEVLLHVSSDEEGLLVLSDTWYPGWRASVDGVEKTILKANICQRAVAISAGKHEVRFVFEPPTVRLGLAVTIVSLVLAAFLLGASRKSWNPSAPPG